MNNIQNKELCLVMGAGVTVDLLPDDKHEFLITEQDVAKGYNVTTAVIQDCRRRHGIELNEGKHFLIHSSEDRIMWTKRGAVCLGFFIGGPKAKTFWDMIEGLRLSPTPESSDTFTFDDKHPVRVVMLSNEPWFVAKDVCDVLGLVNSRKATNALDDDEKSDVTISYTRSKGSATQQRQMTAINESGLYSLIFQSRKSEAKIFRKWVTSEVLPAIRRTGKYTPEIMENDCPYTANLPEISRCPDTKDYTTSVELLLDIMDDICSIEDYNLRTRVATKIRALRNIDIH
jgi:hypothetical protein